MSSIDGHTLVQHGTNTRFDNPLQPEVVQFIREKRLEIDDLFRVFAVLKGVL